MADLEFSPVSEAAVAGDTATAANAAIAPRIGQHEATALGLLRQLVDMPTGSYDAADVDAMGDRLAAEWAAMGFVEKRTPVPGRGAIRCLSRAFPEGTGGRILILGHLDTVWPHEESVSWPYAETAPDRASGPGVGDMKGGLVMAWLAVRALLDSGQPLPSEIAVLLVPDEELGSPGSRAAIEAEAQASRAVLVLEPARPGGEVVMGRGALGAMVLRARGRSAHVGVNPEEGISALLPMAELAVEISALAPGDGASASVGVLKAGAARQVVPEHAEMHVDLRARSQQAAEVLVAEIRSCLAAAEARYPQVQFSIEGGVTRPAFPPERGQALFGLYSSAAAAAGLAPGAVITRGGSDGSFGAALGVPTLDGLGPICFDTCSRRESIILSSIAERATLFATLIALLAAEPQTVL